MTVGELRVALERVDPAIVVVVAASRRATWSQRVIRDVQDAHCAAVEALGEMRMANDTFYGAPGVGDPVTRLVISADETTESTQDGGDGK